jgi:general L-amino acid transport system permease protein
MTEITHGLPLPVEQPPSASVGVIGWLRANLFIRVFTTLLTLIAVYFLAITVPPMIRWAFIDAVWNAPNGQACRGAGGQEVGACWAFIGEKLRFILFGRFPYTEQWRPLLVVVLFIGLILASCDPRMGLRLAILWLAGPTAVGVLMWGGVSA